MKKEGIQTRNRKLSSKGKKKKGTSGVGCLSLSGMMSDMIKPLDHHHLAGGKNAFGAGFGAAMTNNHHLNAALHPHAMSHWYHNGASMHHHHHQGFMPGGGPPPPAPPPPTGAPYHHMSSLSAAAGLSLASNGIVSSFFLKKINLLFVIIIKFSLKL